MQSNKFVVTLCLHFYSKFHLIRLALQALLQDFFKHLMAPYLCMQVTELHACLYSFKFYYAVFKYGTENL